jgi:hypothetical protein
MPSGLDLSSAHLIEGSFTYEDPANPLSFTVIAVGSPSKHDFFPEAKVGMGNYVYVYSYNGINYFGLSAVYAISLAIPNSNPGLPVNTAHAIDKKMDDGLPQTGNVTSQYIDFTTAGYSQTQLIWAGGIQAQGASSGPYNFLLTTVPTLGYLRRPVMTTAILQAQCSIILYPRVAVRT